MDALKGIGHACGHNLIGIAGMFLLQEHELCFPFEIRCCRILGIARRLAEAQHIREDCPPGNTWFVLSIGPQY